MNPTHQTHWHGSSVNQGDCSLDQERAASMADEGGVAGAITDAYEQSQPVSLARRTRWGAARLWAVGAIGVGVAVIAMRQLRRH